MRLSIHSKLSRPTAFTTEMYVTTTVTTIMVFIMATLTAIFFALVDLLIRSGLQGVLGLFG